MNKIAFFVQHMNCAGVENALISLVEKLIKDKEKDITIYVIDDKGAFRNKIPGKVKYRKIPMPEKVRNTIPRAGSKYAINEKMSERNYYAAAVIAAKHIICCGEFAEMQVNFRKIPMLDEEYDIVVNYHIHSPFLIRYLDEKVRAKHKYAFVHNDFTTTGYNVRKLKKYLDCCEGFYCVASKLREEFVDIFPEYREKTHVALNIVRTEHILEKGDEFYPDEFHIDNKNNSDNAIKILTVGRLELQKGYDIAIEVAKRLKEDGLKFIWFVIGDGTERTHLEKLISSTGIGYEFQLLGIKDNPYPYFKNCDIYAQPSRHEGYVTTVTEAKIFNKPIVCTDVSGAREQLEDGTTGDIAEISVESVYEKLRRLVTDAAIRDKYSENLNNISKESDMGYLSIFDV